MRVLMHFGDFVLYLWASTERVGTYARIPDLYPAGRYFFGYDLNLIEPNAKLSLVVILSIEMGIYSHDVAMQISMEFLSNLK
jgi:hypothetical protein